MAIPAQIFVSPLIQWIKSKLPGLLGSLLLDEIRMLSSVHEDIRRLFSKMEIIDDKVRRAEKRQSSEDVVIWLKKLRKISLDAKDTVDLLTSNIRWKDLQEEATPCPMKLVRKFLVSPFILLTSLHEAGARLKKINQELDDILRLYSQLNLSLVLVGQMISGGDDVQPPTGHRLTIPEVYGRGIDEENILNMLLLPGDLQGPSVIVIVGMGGIGKTTLAQSIYNKVYTPREERRAYHKVEFNEKIWVCVSENFDSMKVLESVIKAINKRCEHTEMSQMQTQLEELLRGKRYLLVLEDVWNDNPQRWDGVLASLTCGALGSKILVTTRNQQVAHAMRIREPYKLKGLSDEDTRLVFEMNAFYGEKAENFPKLLEIGVMIVEKCKGVPIAAKVLGSLLFPTREEGDWLIVRDAEISDICNDDEGIRSILRLSYNHLPTHLKQCFAYCSVYPKDADIDVKDLIQQWMAHDFIHPSGSQKMEDIGIRYFNNLLWRSFFQEEIRDVYGNIRKCKMHDLIHDLAESITGDELLMSRQGSINSYGTTPTRHLTRHTVVPNAFQKLKDLHTFSMPYPGDVSTCMFSSLKYLRVLDLSEVYTEELPNSIWNLILLRYLHLSRIRLLPNSISTLLNLQTLRLERLDANLPKDMSLLESLRHLEFEKTIPWDSMPPNFGQLTSLQTLSEFVVSRQEQCSIGELGGLDLGGRLCISKLENVSSGKDAIRAKLIDKQRLQELTLHWSPSAPKEKMKEVLEALQPHQSLKRLEIENYYGDSLPGWLGDLTSLHSLKLTNLKCVTSLPMEIRYLPLQYLVIKRCPLLSERYNRRTGFDMRQIENIPHVSI